KAKNYRTASLTRAARDRSLPPIPPLLTKIPMPPALKRLTHMTRPQHSRRSFLSGSSALLAAATASAAFPWSAKAFANSMAVDRPRVGCIGLGGMGRGDAHGHRSFGDIIALCDVDESQAAKANEDPNIGAGKADLCTDYRKVLERPDIDVVEVVGRVEAVVLFRVSVFE
ncbi:MAG: hypothetical protein ACKPHU_30960, partial [Planctomycetaceae bacterium]